MTNENKAYTIFLCTASDIEANAIQSALAAVDSMSNLSWVKTGDELLRLLDMGERPDFVFLESGLMEENGPRFLSQIREKVDSRRLPIIVYTGTVASECIEISFEKGTTLFTHKAVFLKSEMNIVLEKLLTMYRQGWTISRREGFAVFIDMATGVRHPQKIKSGSMQE
jgi:CheY-like chemotaxis protein